MQVADATPQERAGRKFSAPEGETIWSDHPGLAQACEAAGLTKAQADSALYAACGWNLRLIANGLKLTPDRARNVCRSAARRLSGTLRFRDRVERYWREVLHCVRNRREKGRSPVTLTGVQVTREPFLYPSHEVPEHELPAFRRQLKERRADPKNYAEVSVRGDYVSAGELTPEVDAIQLLRYISDWLRANPEAVVVTDRVTVPPA